jgi:hypothetical protein
VKSKVRVRQEEEEEGRTVDHDERKGVIPAAQDTEND